jgi:hypothetical protein
MHSQYKGRKCFLPRNLSSPNASPLGPKGLNLDKIELLFDIGPYFF